MNIFSSALCGRLNDFYQHSFLLFKIFIFLNKVLPFFFFFFLCFSLPLRLQVSGAAVLSLAFSVPCPDLEETRVLTSCRVFFRLCSGINLARGYFPGPELLALPSSLPCHFSTALPLTLPLSKMVRKSFGSYPK